MEERKYRKKEEHHDKEGRTIKQQAKWTKKIREVDGRTEARTVKKDTTRRKRK